jgi:hypothetical protein
MFQCISLFLKGLWFYTKRSQDYGAYLESLVSSLFLTHFFFLEQKILNISLDQGQVSHLI